MKRELEEVPGRTSGDETVSADRSARRVRSRRDRPKAGTRGSGASPRATLSGGPAGEDAANRDGQDAADTSVDAEVAADPNRSVPVEPTAPAALDGSAVGQPHEASRMDTAAGVGSPDVQADLRNGWAAQSYALSPVVANFVANKLSSVGVLVSADSIYYMVQSICTRARVPTLPVDSQEFQEQAKRWRLTLIHLFHATDAQRAILENKMLDGVAASCSRASAAQALNLCARAFATSAQLVGGADPSGEVSPCSRQPSGAG
ncbi:MAG: hypothetical protein GY772_30630, partial [bacterium]|nr:hypothetical protein [bacterium]